KRQNSLIESLVEHEGDLFTAIHSNFKEILHELTSEQENEQFYRNVYTNMDYQMGNNLFGYTDVDKIDKDFSHLMSYINHQKLAIEHEEQLRYMVEIILSIIIKSIVYKYVKKVSNEEVVERFSTQLQLLQYGFLKINE